jgi:hypothetical protein
VGFSVELHLLPKVLVFLAGSSMVGPGSQKVI